MISLAGRDILHAWGKFAFTGVGLGLLIGVTLVMAGVYRGMVQDGKALLDNSGADLWVVQRDTLGPYAESSSLPDDVYRSLLNLPGVERAANVTYLTMQVRQGDRDVRAMVAGLAPTRSWGDPGWPPHLVAGRHITRSHDEAVADLATGFRVGETIELRRNRYTVVGLTQRMVSSGGDPMVFIPLKDAQDAQFSKDNDAIRRSRARDALTAPPGLPASATPAESATRTVNAVLVRLAPTADAEDVARLIRDWKRFGVHTRAEMEAILIGKLIATSARQIGLFLIILAAVSAAIVAFIIHTLTMEKLREIAVLKLIGTRDRTIAWMIVQQALALGAIGFVVGRITASLSAPLFPKFVLLTAGDSLLGFAAVMLICVMASALAVRMALRVDPAEAIGG